MKKEFLPGDKWIYYKIYCGTTTTNYILLYSIKPLVKMLLEENIINKWFFIRYKDIDSHLRLRLLLNDTNSLGRVIKALNESFKFYLDSGQIWDLQINTYKREIRRYGSNTMKISETFFFNDSENIIKMIENSRDDEELFVFAFKYIESIIKLFNFSEDFLMSFLDTMQKSFKEELGADKTKTKKSLSLMYRKFQKKIHLASQKIEVDNLKYLVNQIILIKQEDKLEVNIEELLSSYLHMSLNRIFSNNQRVFEMVIYDFLNREYKSKSARL
ncbi:thiopeptide-type bacteriocin biosynthesis protein [Tenacibaculum sp. MEBiC06402]|uniref:thiopeptide-type bacteriocin biosynthesis protein n=1 Tax=unclassified Tenacibaculum TaxID=2635139 RepID=UPI003B9B8A6F